MPRDSAAWPLVTANIELGHGSSVPASGIVADLHESMKALLHPGRRSRTAKAGEVVFGDAGGPP
ncbi:MAG: hypothetical protein KGN16_16915 [Burkholderiales bacterium]|nr:hypothetical protein [Burkholderiales bacterium]